MFLKRLISIIFIFLILGVFGWLVFQILKPDRLPVGAQLPAIEYLDEQKCIRILTPDSVYKTLIVHFHENCRYCKYQLAQLEQHVNELQLTRILLLTSDVGFFDSDVMTEWPQLCAARCVSWGIVDVIDFERYFGHTAVPGLYFFDSNGVLYDKQFGEMRFELIKAKLNHSHFMNDN
jgi:hypothetical protein